MLFELVDLEQAPFALFAAGEAAVADRQDARAESGESFARGLRRRVIPHRRIHRRRDEVGLFLELPRKEQRPDRVVREAGGEAVQRVGGRRAEQGNVRPAREPDVVHGPAGLVEVGERRTSGEAFERRGADETQRTGARDRLHRDAAFRAGAR